MFELLGLLYLKIVGYGWLWGRSHWRASKISADDAFGNGGDLFPIGLVGTLCLMLVASIAAAVFGG